MPTPTKPTPEFLVPDAARREIEAQIFAECSADPALPFQVALAPTCPVRDCGRRNGSRAPSYRGLCELCVDDYEADEENSLTLWLAAKNARPGDTITADASGKLTVPFTPGKYMAQLHTGETLRPALPEVGSTWKHQRQDAPTYVTLIHDGIVYFANGSSRALSDWPGEWKPAEVTSSRAVPRYSSTGVFLGYAIPEEITRAEREAATTGGKLMPCGGTGDESDETFRRRALEVLPYEWNHPTSHRRACLMTASGANLDTFAKDWCGGLMRRRAKDAGYVTTASVGRIVVPDCEPVVSANGLVRFDDAPGPAAWGEAVKRRLAEYEAAGLIQSASPTSKYDPATGRITTTIPLGYGPNVRVHTEWMFNTARAFASMAEAMGTPRGRRVLAAQAVDAAVRVCPPELVPEAYRAALVWSIERDPSSSARAHVVCVTGALLYGGTCDDRTVYDHAVERLRSPLRGRPMPWSNSGTPQSSTPRTNGVARRFLPSESAETSGERRWGR